MWNFFARESFPYELGEKVEIFTDYSVFSLYKGTKKNNEEKVSIFSYSKKSGCQEFLEHARLTMKKLKTLKHPSILTYIDSYEDENYIHIVTNHCTPLFSYLKNLDTEQSGEMYLKWGLATIGEAVAFLNHADFRHNNIFHGSVFVDDHGFWQLGEVGYITNLKSNYPNKLTEALRKYDPPEDMLKSLVWCIDNWGLGILLWESFNGELDSSRSLMKPKKVPSELSVILKELTHHKESNKETVGSFIKSCTCNNVLFNTLDALNNYHLKDKDKKVQISKDLLTILPKIPKDIVLNKILSLLKQAYGFNTDNSAYLVPIVAKIPSIVTEQKFQADVEQFIVLLFSSNDRATRLSLLMNIEEFINKISQKSVNEMFPHLSAGFLDSNPKIRGETVKAMVFIAPKLSKKNLNDESMRLLLQIQSKDPEAHIRTNTIICLGKIAYILQPSTRKKILLSAFLSALRDPCPSVRNAGIQAFAVTHRFFPIEVTANNILPGMVYLTVDSDPNVRENAFKTIKILLSKLEQVSQSPDMKETIEKDVMSETCEDNMSWSGWAFAALTSKFLKTAEVKMKSDVLENKKISVSESPLKTPAVQQEKASDVELTVSIHSSESEMSDNDGWRDEKCDGWNDVSLEQNTSHRYGLHWSTVTAYATVDESGADSRVYQNRDRPSPSVSPTYLAWDNPLPGMKDGKEVVGKKTNVRNNQRDSISKRSSGPMKLGTRIKM